MPRSDTQFKKGNPGGPGRPKGSRHKLCEDFINALSKEFEQHGVAAIEKVREENPEEFLKVVGRLVPKEVENTHTFQSQEEWLDSLDE